MTPRKRIRSSRLGICCRCLFLRELLAVVMLTDRWAQFPRSSKIWARRTRATHNHDATILLGEDITQNKPDVESRTGPNLPENRSRMALDFPSFRHHIQGWTEP